MDLVPEWQIGDLLLTDYPYSVDRDSTVDIGEPEVVVDTIVSLMADGDIERERRAGNRTYALTVYVEGADLAEVATNEAALRQELRKSNLILTHTAGDDFSPASAYEVLVARMKVERQDPHESHLIRKVVLTLTCAPFARSAEMVTVAALAVPASETAVTFDTCDSATGWTATVNGVASAVDMAWAAGAVSVHDLLTPGPQTLTLTRTGAVDFSPTRYLQAEIGYNVTLGEVPVVCVADGSRTLAVVEQRLISPGRFLYTFDTRAIDATTLRFSSYTIPDYADLKIFSLKRTDMPPQITTRQKTRILEVGGTERTPASITVNSADELSVLTLAIVHTCPEDGSGYSPPLRRWRVSGPGENVDPSTLSGIYDVITDAGITYDTPTSALPEGGYILAAFMRRASAGTVPVAWSTSTIFPGGSVEQGFTNGIEHVTFPDTNWNLVPLATLSLPSVRTKAGKVRTVIEGLGSGADLYIDEAWLFRVGDDCALTAVTNPYSHMWLNSAGVDGPVPTVWVGDRSSTRVHPGEGLIAQGAHVLSPEGTAVFTASLINDPATHATFYRRWHSNAAE